jgi:hypothetical protein
MNRVTWVTMLLCHGIGFDTANSQLETGNSRPMAAPAFCLLTSIIPHSTPRILDSSNPPSVDLAGSAR